ncbi:MAG: type II toxin-antitoxin system RelE/ParE family toxin [Flavobacteriales bacterium]|nr:type II toxin-antitoxin system RelE/ParE family toxin [Flavobacteriales bacterium]
MASRRIIWTERAIDDLQDIKEFISLDSEIQATKQLLRIFDREMQLITRPGSGGIQTETRSNFEIRYLVQDNYKILYRFTETEVFVLTVFETRQHPEKMKL